MTKALDDLKAALFAAKDGRDACDTINVLATHANKGNDRAKEVLAVYVREGRINHMRVHACSCLAKCVTEPDGSFAALFREGLSDPELRYWSILGYINSAGKDAYREMMRIAEEKNSPVKRPRPCDQVPRWFQQTTI